MERARTVPPVIQRKEGAYPSRGAVVERGGARIPVVYSRARARQLPCVVFIRLSLSARTAKPRRR